MCGIRFETCYVVLSLDNRKPHRGRSRGVTRWLGIRNPDTGSSLAFRSPRQNCRATQSRPRRKCPPLSLLSPHDAAHLNSASQSRSIRLNSRVPVKLLSSGLNMLLPPNTKPVLIGTLNTLGLHLENTVIRVSERTTAALHHAHISGCLHRDTDSFSRPCSPKISSAR